MPNDGTSNAPVPPAQQAGGNAMPIDLSDQIGAQMGTDFHNFNKLLDQTAARFNDGSGFVATESKQSFVLEEKLVGSKAALELERSGLADQINQLKSAGNMPPNTNAGAVGVPKA